MLRPIFRPTVLVCWRACLLALLVGAFGCSAKTSITGASVSGAVRYRGKPITGGVIRLWSDRQDSNQLSAQGDIKNDGTYEIPNAPLGTCKVVVSTEAVKHDIHALVKMDPKTVQAQRGRGRQPVKAPTNYMPIDPKYSNVKTTPIEITIEKGSQTRDIELP